VQLKQQGLKLEKRVKGFYMMFIILLR